MRDCESCNFSSGPLKNINAKALSMRSTGSGFSLNVVTTNSMNPERAFQEQLEIYRRMTGEQRLAIALELHELSCNVAREGIRHQNPGADEAEVERLLRRRLELARQ
jgi:hypothetical protein